MIRYIYLTTNTMTGEQYVGKHNARSTKEFTEYLGSGLILNKQIEKYGRENFKKEIIFYGETDAQLCKAEKYFIWKYHTYKYLDLGGLNLTLGGDGTIGHRQPPRTQEQKMILSDLTKLQWQNSNFRTRMSVLSKNRKPMLGKKHSEETKQKMREARIGKKASDETRIKQSLAKKGIKRPNGYKPPREQIEKWMAASHSQDAIEKMRKSKTGKKKYINELTGEKRFFYPSTKPENWILLCNYHK